MDVEFTEDEQEIRQHLNSTSKNYQRAFALLAAERLLTSLKKYLPGYWLASAEDAVREAWDCLEYPESDGAKFIHCCKKLHGEEIGMHENPVINHVMKSVDSAIGFYEDDIELDEFIAELHHLVKVVEKTAKHPETVDPAVANETDFFFLIVDAVYNSDQNKLPSRDKLLNQLPHPPTTLFGTPD